MARPGVVAVAPAPQRPFVVHAGDGAARSLGAAFSVERIGGEVEVTVTEHTVSLTLPSASGTRGERRSRRLERGQRVRYGGAGFTAVATMDARTALAWRNGKLVFDDRPLGEVVEQRELWPGQDRSRLDGAGLPVHAQNLFVHDYQVCYARSACKPGVPRTLVGSLTYRW